MKHPIPDLAITALAPRVRAEARRQLEPVVGVQQTEAVASAAEREYGAIHSSLPESSTVGASVMVHLAAMTLAYYKAVVSVGVESPRARCLVAKINWAVYEGLTSLPWALTRIGGDDALVRTKRAMDMFMVFPYASPGYEMEYVDTDEHVVGFDVRRCPVAEFFASYGLSELCTEAFCDLDDPLADRWGVRLERRLTLATGGARCTFRFLREDVGGGDDPEDA